jgi:hypothetical protein
VDGFVPGAEEQAGLKGSHAPSTCCVVLGAEASVLRRHRSCSQAVGPTHGKLAGTESRSVVEEGVAQRSCVEVMGDNRSTRAAVAGSREKHDAPAEVVEGIPCWTLTAVVDG